VTPVVRVGETVRRPSGYWSDRVHELLEFPRADWDFAAPGSRAWDVAYALGRFVLLYDDRTCARLGWPVVPRGPRIARLLDAYGLDGLDGRDGILRVVRERQAVVRATVLEDPALAGLRRPALAGLRREGRVAEIENDMGYAERCRREWQRLLARRGHRGHT
jgi:hypothetical protein